MSEHSPTRCASLPLIYLCGRELMLCRRACRSRIFFDDRCGRSGGIIECSSWNGGSDSEAKERVHQTGDSSRCRFGSRFFIRRERCALQLYSRLSLVSRMMRERFVVQIFKQLANARGTRLYKLQKKFQAVFGFTLREFWESSRCLVRLNY